MPTDDELKELLGRCFGTMDREFGGHPIEREAARELLAEACQRDIGRLRIEQLAHECMAAWGCTKEHIAEQVAKMRDLSSWLDD